MIERDSPRHSGAVAALAAAVAFLALIQATTLGAAALGLRLCGSGAAPAAIVSAALAGLFARAFLRRNADGLETSAVRSRREPGTPSPLVTGLVIAALAWAASVWIRLWVLALHRPPYDWDGLYYRIPAVSGWALLGRVGWLDVPDVPFVNYPLGAEAHTFFVHRIVASARLLTATNLWYWPLGFLALVVIATRLGARGPWRWLPGALLAGVPVVVCQSATCYTDPAFAFSVMAALAAILLFALDRDRPTIRCTILLGASLGLMAGIKGTGAPFAIALLAAALAAGLFAHGGRNASRWMLSAGLAALIALSIGGYWYLRNALETGNPLHPIELRVGALLLSAGYDPVVFSEANLPEWLGRFPPALRVVVSWLQLDAPISGYAPVGGLGYLWVAFALPAALALGATSLRRRREPAAAGLLLLWVLVLLLFAIQPSAWWSRFTIWLHALGLPALAVVLQRIEARRPALNLAVGSIAMVAALGVAAAETERSLRIEWNTGRVTEAGASGLAYRSSSDWLFPGLTETPGYDRFLSAPSIARSPWSRLGTLLGGVLAMPPGRRSITIMPAPPDAEDVEGLRDRGITWVLWDEIAAGPVPEVIAGRAREAHEWRSGSDAAFHILRLGEE